MSNPIIQRAIEQQMREQARQQIQLQGVMGSNRRKLVVDKVNQQFGGRLSPRHDSNMNGATYRSSHHNM